MNTFIEKHRLRDRFKMLSLLFMPGKALKYFPPDFTVRDPVMSRIHNARSKGVPCALMLFAIRPPAHEPPSAAPQAMGKQHKQIRQALVSLVSRYYKEDHIVGMKQAGDHYIVFIAFPDAEPRYDDIDAVASRLGGGLALRLVSEGVGAAHDRWHVDAGCYLLEQDLGTTEAAVQSAYLVAQLIATKKLPAGYAQMRQRILHVLQEEDISVFAQPIMNLESGDIFGWELLTRGPAGGPFHMPAELFAFADQADLLPRLERLVIRKALREIAGRRIREQVFLNITPVSLADPSLLAELLGWLTEYPEVSPAQIVFEITERHAVRDYARMGDIIRSYREHGFRFAIDDAGAGYSSLQSIIELIPDMIKIDRSVIQNIDRVSVKQSLLKALLYFAENINCQVIAEGVETKEEANVLVSHRVRIGQGFYFAKPEPIRFGYGHNHFADLKEKIIQLRQTSSA